MANVKFTDLPNLANITAATIVPVVAANVNYTVTAANLQSYVNSTTGNVTANYFIGNGSQLTGIASSYGNANVAAYLPTFSGNLNPNNVNVTGDVTLGNTGFLNVGQASLATGNTVPSVLNITGVATVAAGNVSATGTVRAVAISASGTVTGNTVNAGTVSATGNITGAFVLGNISAATGGYGNAQVQAVLQTYTGTLTAASISASGNIAGNFFIGNGSQLTGIAASFSGNMVGNINANTFNITNANVISANTFTGSGSQLTGIPTSIIAGAGISVNASTGAVTITNNNPTPYANANVAAYLLTNTGNIAAGNISATGNITGTHAGNGAGLSNVVTSITAGSGISVNAATGAVTITATGGGSANSISNGTSNVSIPTANGNISLSTGGTSNTILVTTNNVFISANLECSGLTTAVNKFIMGGYAPVTSSGNGTPGTFTYGSSGGSWYLYMCVGTNSWRRVLLSSF